MRYILPNSFLKNVELTFLAALSMLNCFGQKTESTKDTEALKNQINEMVVRSFELSQSYPDSALSIAQGAFDLSQQINFQNGRASSLHKMAVVYRFQGYYDKAIQYGDSALQYINDLNSDALKAALYSNQGVSFRYKGEYDKALDYYQKSIALHRKLGHQEETGSVLNSIGVMYMYLEDYQKAIGYYQEALEIQLAENNQKELANIYNNFAIIYANQDLLDSSLFYFQKSYDMEKAMGNKKGMSESLNNIGVVDYYLGDIEAAIEKFQESLVIDTELGDIKGQITCMLNIGEMYNISQEYDKAIEVLTKALKAAREIDSKHDVETAYLNLSESYQGLDNLQMALDIYIAYANVHDTILNQEQMESIAEMETKYQTKEKEQQIVIQDLKLEDQRKDIEERNQTIISLGIILLLILILSVFAYKAFKTKKAIEMERALRIEEEKRLDAVMDATEMERKKMSSELHDGIGQQLSSIKLSIGAMEGNLSEASPTTLEKLKLVKSIVDESARDVRNLSHQMMPKSLTELGLAPALEDMLQKTLGIAGISYHYDAENMKAKLSEKVAVNMYRIMQEITNNILKHSDATEVDIQLYSSNDKLNMIYAENGSKFDLNLISKGHGLLNIETRIRNIGGTIRLERESENQFVITIQSPVS